MLILVTCGSAVSTKTRMVLLRQYFPKKTSFDDLTEEHILEVENLLNNRPRKCLDWKAPQDIFVLNAQPPPVALVSWIHEQEAFLSVLEDF